MGGQLGVRQEGAAFVWLQPLKRNSPTPGGCEFSSNGVEQTKNKKSHVKTDLKELPSTGGSLEVL